MYDNGNLARARSYIFITTEKGGAARVKGGGEKEKECTTEGKSRRRRDEKALSLLQLKKVAPWALKLLFITAWCFGL